MHLEISSHTSFAVFNVRATSSRRSEVVSSPVLCPLLESLASSICSRGSHDLCIESEARRPTPKGLASIARAPTNRDRAEVVSSPDATSQLRRASRTASSLRLTSSGRVCVLWPASRSRRTARRAAGRSPRLRRAVVGVPTRARVSVPGEPPPPSSLSAPRRVHRRPYSRHRLSWSLRRVAALSGCPKTSLEPRAHGRTPWNPPSISRPPPAPKSLEWIRQPIEDSVRSRVSVTTLHPPEGFQSRAPGRDLCEQPPPREEATPGLRRAWRAVSVVRTAPRKL